MNRFTGRKRPVSGANGGEDYWEFFAGGSGGRFLAQERAPRTIPTELSRNAIKLAEQRGARNVRVFGSVARGTDTSDSDVDFLVELDEETTLLQHNALIRELGDLLGCKVDVVSERGLRPRVRDRVLREAAPL